MSRKSWGPDLAKKIAVLRILNVWFIMYNKGSYFFKKWIGRKLLTKIGSWQRHCQQRHTLGWIQKCSRLSRKTCNEKCIEWFPFIQIQGFNQHADAV